MLPTVVSWAGPTGMGAIPYPIRLVIPGLTWLCLRSNSNAPGARAYSGLQGDNVMFTRKTRFGRLTASRKCFSFEQRRVAPNCPDSACVCVFAYII